METEVEEIRVAMSGRLPRILGPIGLVAGVVGLVAGTAILGANAIFTLPNVVRLMSEGIEINPDILVSPFVGIMMVLRAVLLVIAARSMLKEKATALRWALRYGIVSLVTVPLDTYILYTSGSMSVSTDAGAFLFALVRLLIPLAFLAFAISSTRQDRAAQEETTT